MIVSIIKYLQKVIENFPEVIRSTAATPASEHLFQVGDEKNRKFLPDEQAQHFQHTVAQILFLCIRARPYMQPFIYFLTTIVRFPEEYDWERLKRGLKYLGGTLYMKLYLSTYVLNMVRLWLCASYGTHWDFRSHTGAVMSMGKGEIMIFSIK